ncbi:MAG: hypothetical protein U0744_05880 [Gemmataceae bacterium]
MRFSITLSVALFAVSVASAQYPQVVVRPARPVIGLANPLAVTPIQPFLPPVQQSLSIQPNGTGGFNTNGTTVHQSALDPFREISKLNGSMQTTQQPIFSNGQLVGYAVKETWQNSVTGQQHSNTVTVGNNHLGGIGSHTEMRMAPRGGTRIRSR